MKDIVNQLFKLPQAVKIVILIILMIAIGAFYFFIYYVPKTQEVKRLQRDVAERERTKIESMAIAANREKLEEEVSLMNEKLKHALTLLPNETDIRGILRNISLLAGKIGIDLLYFRPGSVANRGLFSEIPIDLRLGGSYNEIAVFFDRIGKLSRIVNIRDISMASPTKKENAYQVTVNCQAVTFMSSGGGGG
jgi:type IV pilus assembly protein PilO